MAAARVLAGRATLPPTNEQEKWEVGRIAQKGDGPAFTVLNPEFEAYFEALRSIAGNPAPGTPGRPLPPFEPEWVDKFNAGHERRIQMWKRANNAAAAELECSSSGNNSRL